MVFLVKVRLWNSDSMQHYGSNDSIDLTRYHRQYCALTNKEGHRLIYLNTACSHAGQQGTVRPENGHQEGWVMVADGGLCYFQALFDLTVDSMLVFMVNGDA